MTDLAAHYIDEIKRQLRGHKRMAESAMSQLNDGQFFTTIDPESNSVAILVKHIAGNAHSRFTDFLTADGEKPDRFRDHEFDVNQASRAELMRYWEEGWSIVFAAIGSLTPEGRHPYSHHPSGTAHRITGAQSCTRSLRAAHRTDRIPCQAPALLRVEDA